MSLLLPSNRIHPALPSHPEPPQQGGHAKVTGAARYAFDAALPGMLHAKVLRSPHPHARIRGIDTAKAAALPGVVAIVTGADARALALPTYGFTIQDQPVIAIDKVRHVGEAVVAVAARDERTALAALALVDVDYDPLPALPDPAAALAPGAPLLFEEPQPGFALPVGAGSTSRKEPAPNVLYEYTYTRGGVDAALDRADHVFTDSFAFSAINHYHLEPHVNVARFEDGRLELWSSNQDPFMLRADLSRIFGMPDTDIRVHTPLIGGGFGGKSYCKMEPLVALIAQKARRPVRLALTLDESILTLTKHAAELTLTTAVGADGRLLARRADIVLDGGAYCDASVMVALKTGFRIAGAYHWDALDVRSRVVRTTKVPAGSFRGFGGTQASYASECQMDMIAHRLGIDPYDLRVMNFLGPDEPFAPGDSAIDSDLKGGLDEVCTRLGYRAPKKAGHGFGLAVGIKDGGGTGNHAGAIVKVSQSGRITVLAATAEIGQGAGTTLCSIAADVLGLDAADARYGAIDTDVTPLNNGTHVSCGTVVTGSAVAEAAASVREEILAFAAEQLQCAPADLALEGWAVRRNGALHPLEPMVRGYYGGQGFAFTAYGHVKVPYDDGAPLRSQNLFWMPCWTGAEVSVDRETGRVTVHRLVVGSDAGRIISRRACEGQVAGAAIQAYGQAMFESLRYTPALQPENATPWTYRVAQAADLPEHFEVFVTEHMRGPGPGGLKGIGEAGMLSIAAAIGNAIEDATGVRVNAMPFSPEAVLAALDAADPA
ncbi:xanthine dehydrogenase family protein molybdopterin-binding subunit [Acuticoccus mangrovi]|uniref:Xanthine dehydrogenase family protein molybdopterin-binding subunit n=1 Tax=Acuticoccus mangrovi TaxID=2796142 RepID=A0A934IKS9_9HYPH|nr:xanthine dehydrogenase family protein molybdopterin-binding subunit [Acuticoccus mangrovi]MBJ3775622.1 xanthine dehydrogenase family protein molybdopterin-binding subunit [Acuticoccus mangrovi]